MNNTTAKITEAFEKNIALIESMRALDMTRPVSEVTITKIRASIEELDDVFNAARAASAGFVNSNPLCFRRRICGWVFRQDFIRSDPDYTILYSAVNNAVKEVFKLTETE